MFVIGTIVHDPKLQCAIQCDLWGDEPVVYIVGGTRPTSGHGNVVSAMCVNRIIKRMRIELAPIRVCCTFVVSYDRPVVESVFEIIKEGCHFVSRCSVHDGVAVAIAVPCEIHSSADDFGVKACRSRTSHVGGESLRGSPDTHAVFTSTVGAYFDGIGCFRSKTRKCVRLLGDINKVGGIVVKTDLPC